MRALAFTAATCSGVKNSPPANSAYRCRGVRVTYDQTPCRSGSPHGVRSAATESADWLAAGTGASPTIAIAANAARCRPFI